MLRWIIFNEDGRFMDTFNGQGTNTLEKDISEKKCETRGGWAVPSSASKAQAFWVQWSYFFGLNCWWLYCWIVELLDCWIVDLLNCWMVKLLKCQILELFSCWIVEFWKCWGVGLLNCWIVELLSDWLIDYLIDWLMDW